ncbi:MAG: tRNA (adenosine(37)-N6)-dimethylallyltransferase MiaA [Alphaproteobacteria bacterium]|jgi:tRNA dimethylallyltransferase|nr:tRNA (adenosine(37)-N6)-dimethylallyltransferase MiaA [Alphaproteobacteria bacterium]
MRPALLIHGPTASGKTELAIALAKALDGEIVNADSMQVYRDLRLLTARPSEAEEAEVPHHLFGRVDAAERYSTGKWLGEARSKLADIQRRGKLAIFVGGTGLYFLSMIQGLSDIPPVPEDVHSEVRALVNQEGVASLHSRLQAIDPATAGRLSPNDRQRIMRAFEVWLATGRPLSELYQAPKSVLLDDGEWLGIALTPPRSRLYARIDRRFEGMMMRGAMDEARALLARGLDPQLPAMKAHGMPWLAKFIGGEISPEEAAENAKRDTRRYAKRQFTWIGRQFPFWPRLPSPDLGDRKKVIFALFREIDRR